MRLYTIVNQPYPNEDRDSNFTFHEDILDILFKYKDVVYKNLIDLKGVLLIDHIAINIIDPRNKMVIFSLNPSVEYNLIVQNLWKYDKSFSSTFFEQDGFYVWEEAYSENYFDKLKYIKESKHGFNFCFNITKKVCDFKLIYSFATRSQNKELFEFYNNYMIELMSLGDYGYKLMHHIYQNYCDPQFVVPTISCRNASKKPLLKLIINDN